MSYSSSDVSPAAVGVGAIVVILVLVAGLFMPWSCTTVQERQVAVPTWNGKISGEVKTADLHWYNPIFGDLVVYDTAFKTFQNNYSAKSLNKQALDPVPITVTHRLNGQYAGVILAVSGSDYESTVVNKHLEGIVTNIAVRYNIDELHGNKEAIQAIMQQELQDMVNRDLPNNALDPKNKALNTVKTAVLVWEEVPREVPDGVDENGNPQTKVYRELVTQWEERDNVPDPVIKIEKLVIQDWGFSKVIRDRIESKQEAIQRAEQRRNEVAETQAEADKKIAAARGTAEERKALADAAAYAVEAAAKAEAESIRMRAEAEAKALGLLGETLRKYPEALRARWIERWDGRTPQVLSGSEGSGLIFQLPGNGRSEHADDNETGK